MDNVCSYCGRDRGEEGILAVSACEHFISSDQCNVCATNQVCFICDKRDPSIANTILRKPK